MDEGRRLRGAAGILLVTVLVAALQGCASIAEGVTRGLSAKDGEKPARPCDVTGPAFQGISEGLRRLELSGSAVVAASTDSPRLKVMMVHGIGTHPPSYSARFQRNLTQALGLTKREELIKEIGLRAPEFFGDEPLGHLRVFRYMNEAGTQEMLFIRAELVGDYCPRKIHPGLLHIRRVRVQAQPNQSRAQSISKRPDGRPHGLLR